MLDRVGPQVRIATDADYPALAALERRAFTTLGSSFYPLQDVECALDYFEGLTVTLINEGHYFVLPDANGGILAAGGWSRHGLDYMPQDTKSAEADRTGVVRCVYVDPLYARRGHGSTILRHIEWDAFSQGVRRLTLTSSKTAEALYARAGYVAGPYHGVPLPNGSTLHLRPMAKTLVCVAMAAGGEQ